MATAARFPFVGADDVEVGAYVLDLPSLTLYCVVEICHVLGGRVAVLEDARTGGVESWEVGDLRRLRLVRGAR